MPTEREEFEQAVRAVIAKDAISERIASHWSHLFPRVDDENTLITACLTGLFSPIELGVSRSCFTGHRWNIWAAVEHHYQHAADFRAPDLQALADWMQSQRVNGPVLDELLTLRDASPFQVEEYVLLAAARVREAYRARELAVRLERAAMRLHCGDRVDQVLEDLRGAQV